MSTEIREFPVVTLCGSSKFKDAFIGITKELSLAGAIVIGLGLFGHADNLFGEEITPEIKAMLDSAHRQKIDMCDAIYVINVNDYIGTSTLSEIEYAQDKNKKIFLLEPSKHIPGGLPQFGDIYQWITEFRRCSRFYRQNRYCQKKYTCEISLSDLANSGILKNCDVSHISLLTPLSIEIREGYHGIKLPEGRVKYSPTTLLRAYLPSTINTDCPQFLQSVVDHLLYMIQFGSRHNIPCPDSVSFISFIDYLKWRVVKIMNTKNTIIIYIIPFDSINSYKGLEIDLRGNN